MQKDIYSRLKYPSEACITGTTVLQFTVNKLGNVESPVIRKSLYYKIDEQLLAMICDYEFYPGEMHGVPVGTNLLIPIWIGLK